MAGLQSIQAVGGGVLPGVQPVLDFVGVVHSGAFSAVRGTSLAHTCRWHYVSASSSPGPGAHIKAGVGHAPGWQFHSWQRQIWQTWCIAQGTNCKPGSSARISALTQQGHQAPCWQIHGWQQRIWCFWWMARAVIRVPLSTRHLWCVCCCSTVMSGAI